METLTLEICEIRNIKKAKLEISLESGVYAIVGNNGTGKSTILQCLAQSISRYNLGSLKNEDVKNDSFVSFAYDQKINKWTRNNNAWWSVDTYPNDVKFNGNYEGSLFYGQRFEDSKSIDQHLQNGVLKHEDIVDADDYVKEKLSFILHGNLNQYHELKRVRNKKIAKELEVGNTPYFNSVNGNLISQYRMSSGECLLVSLLHFIYNSIIRKSLPENEKILMLIDEVELALHPSAISRLLDLFFELVEKNKNLTIIITSHSPEVIRRIKPNNLYNVKKKQDEVILETGCYPGYVIRDIYMHDGFDYLLLVEDKLAKMVVEKILQNENLRINKSIHVVPVGGWENVLQLQNELLSGNVLGLNKQVISILDGDVENIVGDEYKYVKKLFLPIKSVEKFIYKMVFEENDYQFVRILNSKYFPIKSVEALKEEHVIKYNKPKLKEADKKFYFRLRKDLESRNISEEVFITYLCDDIMKFLNFDNFIGSLKSVF